MSTPTSTLPVYEFQSTLPREERHSCLFQLLLSCFISIHAPTRGATIIEPSKIEELKNFNPRSHERSDFMQETSLDTVDISIHAPTRGATYTFKVCYGYMIFQSTLPREERQFFHQLYSQQQRNFNPRSHERSDCL